MAEVVDFFVWVRPFVEPLEVLEWLLTGALSLVESSVVHLEESFAAPLELWIE